jgi:tRNA (mo5U34)-methyltransferase
MRPFQIGSVEIVVSMPDKAAERITKSAAYRKLLRPTGRWLYRGLSGRHSAARAPRADADRPSLSFPRELPRPQALGAEGQAILEKIKDVEWYHSIDLGHGVTTPGFVDHRDQVANYHLPASLAGKRCLDVATFDGFWAFEMERRGAREVIALDVARWSDCDIPLALLEATKRFGADRPTGEGFKIAHETLHSGVKREICNVYDLSPERIGTFDYVFVSDLLLHLRDPQRALEQMYSVCRGEVLVGEVYNPALESAEGLCLTEFAMRFPSATWWCPNTNTLIRMMTVAGFEPVTELSRFVLNVPGADGLKVTNKVVLRGQVPARHSWEGSA